MIPILFRDDRFVVLDKPPGLPVHPGPRGGPSVEDCFPLLSRRKDGPWLAHRLDADTAGCLVVALRRAALIAAQAEFAAGRARKTYWAVVRGIPPGNAGTIDAPLRRHSSKSGWRMVGDASGQRAVTDWRLCGQAGDIAWLELFPAYGTHAPGARALRIARLPRPRRPDLRRRARPPAIAFPRHRSGPHAAAGRHRRAAAAYARCAGALRLARVTLAGGIDAGLRVGLTLLAFPSREGEKQRKPPCRCARRAPSPVSARPQYLRGTDRTPLSLQLEASLNAIDDAGLKPTRHRRRHPVWPRRRRRGFRHQFRHSGPALFRHHADGRRLGGGRDPVRHRRDRCRHLQPRAAGARPHRLFRRPHRRARAADAAVPRDRRVRDAVRRDRAGAALCGDGAAAHGAVRHHLAAIRRDRRQHAQQRDAQPERDDAAADDRARTTRTRA